MLRSGLACLFALMGIAASGCDQVFQLDRPDSDVVAGACPSGFETSKHRVFLDPKDWTTAEAACVALTTQPTGMFTHLVVAETQGEWVDLARLNTGVEIWVGGSDRKVEGTFAWVTSQRADAIPWGSTTGQPDGGDTSDCIKLRDTLAARPDDADCTELHAYVCECDDYPEQSPPNF